MGDVDVNGEMMLMMGEIIVGRDVRDGHTDENWRGGLADDKFRELVLCVLLLLQFCCNFLFAGTSVAEIVNTHLGKSIIIFFFFVKNRKILDSSND